MACPGASPTSRILAASIGNCLSSSKCKNEVRRTQLGKAPFPCLIVGTDRMAQLRELTTAFSAAVGHRRYVLPSLTVAAGGLLDFAMLKLGILIDAEGPFAYLPFAIAVALAGAMIMWWLLDYAASGRSELRGIVD